jgi:hypothetical protein
VPKFEHSPVMVAEVLAALRPSPAAGTWTGLPVGLDTRQPYWPRVRRMDGCMGAIAMARRLKRRNGSWRTSPAD